MTSHAVLWYEENDKIILNTTSHAQLLIKSDTVQYSTCTVLQ